MLEQKYLYYYHCESEIERKSRDEKFMNVYICICKIVCMYVYDFEYNNLVNIFQMNPHVITSNKKYSIHSKTYSTQTKPYTRKPIQPKLNKQEY